MDNLMAVILAAGKGTRMKSATAKVLHPVAGKLMLYYPVKAAQHAGCTDIIVVVGHQREAVEASFQDEQVRFAHQDPQLGSGHAVSVAAPLADGFDGDVLILCGDVPMIAASTLKQLVEEHRSSGAAVSVLSVVLDNPCGYGRILRNEKGSVYGIREERDASAEQRSISEINTGIYCCTASFLFDALKHIGTDNDQGEYYLPDIVSVAAQRRLTVNAIITPDPEEVAGINDRAALARAEKCMRGRILKAHMDSGVTIIDPDSTYIDTGVRIGRDTVVFPNSHIAGSTEIGSACRIEISCCVRDSLLGDGVHLRPSCVLDRCHVKDHAIIGPFAHLRPDALVEPEAHIGNFVEVKKSVIGKGSKANHLTYIGDATIGEGANIGAGTITCNYDGKHKHPTVIRDGAFIGSNTALVAPVTVGRNAVVGAGSTITKNVPEDSLSVARGRQRNYDNFFKKKGSRGDTRK